MLRRVSNGLRLNFWATQEEPKGAWLRVVAYGGRFAGPNEPGPAGLGSMVLGTRTVAEGGVVGPWVRDQVRWRGLTHFSIYPEGQDDLMNRACLCSLSAALSACDCEYR